MRASGLLVDYGFCPYRPRMTTDDMVAAKIDNATKVEPIKASK